MLASKTKIIAYSIDDNNSTHETTILWCGFNDSDNDSVISIQRYIEEHAASLRESYLAVIYELGERLVGEQCVVDHLKIREKFSYWWMTLLTEKCNFAKSPQIDDAIKLLALEHFLDQYNVKQIVLVSANAVLDEVLQEWCKKHGVGFKCTKQAQAGSKGKGIKQFYKQLPLRIQAIIWLLYRIVKHRHLAGVGVEKWRQSNATTSFVSYLFNLVSESASQGKFESRYWGSLPEGLTKNEQSTRWLHLWISDNIAPSAKVAKLLVDRFNRATDTRQVHVTLDSFRLFSA